MHRIQRISLLVFLPVIIVLAAAWIWPAGDGAASTDPEIGEPAPNFTLPGTDGESYTLADFEGEYVVLEWLNFGCPYVKRHYNSGNMPALQEEYTGKGVNWLSIVSSAPGKQGYYEPDDMNAKNEEMGGMMDVILLDPEGDVGMTYGAITTPHMYIIGPDGTLLYKGGIDDRPRAPQDETASIPSYVGLALDAALNGEEIEVTSAQPYGCDVKYAD